MSSQWLNLAHKGRRNFSTGGSRTYGGDASDNSRGRAERGAGRGGADSRVASTVDVADNFQTPGIAGGGVVAVEGERFEDFDLVTSVRLDSGNAAGATASVAEESHAGGDDVIRASNDLFTNLGVFDHRIAVEIVGRSPELAFDHEPSEESFDIFGGRGVGRDIGRHLIASFLNAAAELKTVGVVGVEHAVALAVQRLENVEISALQSALVSTAITFKFDISLDDIVNASHLLLPNLFILQLDLAIDSWVYPLLLDRFLEELQHIPDLWISVIFNSPEAT